MNMNDFIDEGGISCVSSIPKMFPQLLIDGFANLEVPPFFRCIESICVLIEVFNISTDTFQLSLIVSLLVQDS